MNRSIAGAAAGAVGSAALNITTYLDMLERGRSPSQLPAEMAGELADDAGVDLALGDDDGSKAAGNRRQALGQLLGYAAGLAVGIGFALLRRAEPPRSVVLSAIGLGASAMIATDGPAVLLGKTDPRRWGMSGWASDVVPHLAYGVSTALTYRALSKDL